ncbi:MAG: hypothetical protein IPL79_16890 [Myxococcales bacterium]|nr:hypothetical protein [Myxococcales bacterium]
MATPGVQADTRVVIIRQDGTPERSEYIKTVQSDILRANEFTLLPSTAMRERLLVAPVDGEAAIERAVATSEGASSDALARFNHPTALRECLQGQQQLSALSSRPMWRARVVSLLVLEARIHLSAGQEAAAIASLRTAYRTNPGLVLDPARYAPDVLAAYAIASQPAPTLKFVVRVDGEAARLNASPPGIWIDGDRLAPSQVGTTWSTSAELAEGPHFIRIEAFGHASTSERIIIQPGAPSEIYVALAPLGAMEMIEAWRQQLARATSDVAITTAAQQLIAQTSGHAVVAFRRGPLGEPQTVVWPGEGRDVSIVFGDADPTEIVRRLRVATAPRLDRPPVWRRRWAQWTAAGVAVGAISAAILLSRKRDTAALDPVIVIQ